VSDEQLEQETDEPSDEPGPARIVDGVRIRKGATHWRLSRFGPEGKLSLPIGGTNAATGRQIMALPVEDFSVAAIRQAYGTGVFQIGWRKVDEEGDKTLGHAELRIAPPPVVEDEAPKPARRACLRCGAELIGRFCAQCGADASSSSPPPATLPVPPPASDAGGLLAAFQAGVTFSAQALQSMAATARAESEERTKRYEIDMRTQLEQQRMQHEKSLKEQAAFLTRSTKSETDASDALVAKIGALVQEEVSALTERIDELEAKLEEEDDDEPEPAPQPEAGSWTEKAKAASTFVSDVATPVAQAIGGLVEQVRSNGKASNVPGGSPTS